MTLSVATVKMQSFWPLTSVNLDAVARRRGNPSGPPLTVNVDTARMPSFWPLTPVNVETVA